MRSSLTPLGNKIVAGFVLFIAGFVYISIQLMSQEQKEVVIEQIQKPIEIVKPKPKTVTLGFVGDIIPHTPISSSAKNDNEFDYTPVFSEILDILNRPDIMIGNLETPVSGTNSPSGYPRFNAPISLLPALKSAGFDALQIANNHSLDQGVQGLESTLTLIAEHNMIPIGGTLYPKMEYQPVIEVHNDITIAFINATYGFNGFTLPKDKSYLANTIDIERLEKSIQSARDQGAEIVIILPHFGTEYQQTPNDSQKKLANELLLAGADAVIGTHPHVVQPVEIVRNEDSNRIIAYSLGNFLSNQRDEYTDLELYLELTYSKNTSTGEVVLESYTTIPLYMRRDSNAEKSEKYNIYTLDNALKLENLTNTEKERLLKYDTEFESIITPSAVLN